MVWSWGGSITTNNPQLGTKETHKKRGVLVPKLCELKSAWIS